MTPDDANQKSKLATQVAITGLIAGTMDILAASIQFYIETGNGPLKIFQYIASAVFGPEAFSDNIWMAVTGLFFHYCIAYGWTVLLFLLYPIFALLRQNKFATGIGYGVFVWLVMNLMVVPMSRIPARPINPGQAAEATLILIFCIGLPISLMANRFFSQNASSK